MVFYIWKVLSMLKQSPEAAEFPLVFGNGLVISAGAKFSLPVVRGGRDPFQWQDHLSLYGFHYKNNTVVRPQGKRCMGTNDQSWINIFTKISWMCQKWLVSTTHFIHEYAHFPGVFISISREYHHNIIKDHKELYISNFNARLYMFRIIVHMWPLAIPQQSESINHAKMEQGIPMCDSSSLPLSAIAKLCVWR